MLRPGEILETAMWADGRETPEQMARFESDLKEQLAYFADQEGVIIGPLTVLEKRPGGERVPPVPDDISGPNVRLVVGTAKVLCSVPQFTIQSSRFVDDLDAIDLARLRQTTRASYARHFPKRPSLSELQCDQIIDEIGPEAALETLRSETRH